jgi:hypothetical protein
MPSKRSTGPAKIKVSPGVSCSTGNIPRCGRARARPRRGFAARLQPDIEHRLFDDDADIEPILLCEPRMRERHRPSGVRLSAHNDRNS